MCCLYVFQLSELSSQAWTAKDEKMRSTTIVRFIQQSNRVSVWVAALILKEPKVRLRRKIVCNMIALMEVCAVRPRARWHALVPTPLTRACLGASAGPVQCLRNTRNFHSLMAVLAGLSMAAVSRLKFTSNNLGSRINKV